MRSRYVYVLLGVLSLVVVAGGWVRFNHSFTLVRDTDSITSESPTSSAMATSTLSLTSIAFENGGMVPPLYTCDGSHVSPPLSISGVPEGAKSLVLIVDDPDVPKAVLPAGVFDHWVLFNIPVTTTEIAQGGSAGTVGANSSGQNAYAGPCPPPQYDPPEHRYFFKLYALNAELPLKEGASKADVEKAMDGHVIAETRLMGRYERK